MSSPVQVLASIIQGEANNPADQFGVASVIYNRAQSNYGGYGNDPFAQATAPSQFSAYPNNLQTPSANALNLAQALESGNLSSYGDTGNARFYNAPNTNPAYASGAGNNYGPGTNQYSDVYNQPPSSNFQLPTQTPSQDQINNDLGETGNSAPNYDLPFESDGGNDNPIMGSGASGAADNSGSYATGTVTFPDGSSGGFTTQPSSLTSLGLGSPTAIASYNQGSGALASGSGATVQAPPGAINTQAPQASGTQTSNSGQPIYETNAPTVASQGLNAIAKAGTQVGADVQQAESSAAATGTGWLSSIYAVGQTFAISTGLVLLGLILLLGAFAFFYIDNNQKSAPAILPIET